MYRDTWESKKKKELKAQYTNKVENLLNQPNAMVLLKCLISASIEDGYNVRKEGERRYSNNK